LDLRGSDRAAIGNRYEHARSTRPRTVPFEDHRFTLYLGSRSRSCHFRRVGGECPQSCMMIDEIIDNFSLLDEWDDRYRYLIELGKTLAPLSERARTGINKVQGSACQAWLSTKVRPNGSGGPVLEFVGDSDAHIVRGLIAVLLALL